MNMAYNLYQDPTWESQDDKVVAGKEKLKGSDRRASYARGRRPSSVNGIHKRRNKRFAW